MNKDRKGPGLVLNECPELRPLPGAEMLPLFLRQYTAMAYGQRLKATGLVGSMGSIGDCYDNALMESFWATLQTELLDRQTWPIRSSLRSAIFEFIEGFYNPRRAHSSLGFLSPNDFERRWAQTATRDQPQAS